MFKKIFFIISICFFIGGCITNSTIHYNKSLLDPTYKNHKIEEPKYKSLRFSISKI